jgi:fatty-acyl-CoA synthase
LETALYEHPAVQSCAVVGVPDPKWGEVGRAFVVPRPDALLTEAQVAAHARTRLAGYKVPKSVCILPEIPRLGSGKPDRRALAALEPAGAAS